MTCLSDAFQQFLDRPGISKHTREKYFYRLRRFVDQHAAKEPRTITTTMLTAYIDDQPELAEASRAILRQSFHAFLAFCGCEPNPASALPRWRETPRRIIIPDETAVQLALNAAVEMTCSGEARDIRDGCIFALSIVSGNRRGELHNLPLDDLLIALANPEQGVYRVETEGKTGEAVTRFTSFHVPLICRWLAVRPLGRSPHVFVVTDSRHECYGRQLSLTGFNRARPRVCRRAGVQTITYQDLRRRFATMIARAEGVDVAANALGHSPHSGDRVVRPFYYDPDRARADRAAMAAFGGLNELHN